jgi:hypothetical protein
LTRSNLDPLPKFILFVLVCGLIQACATPKDLYRVSSIRWVGDSIALQVVNKQDPPRPVSALETEFECLNCNLHLDSWERELDQKGEARFLLPEAKQLVTTRIKVSAYGIDTPAVLHQRDPEEATRYYRLATPLTGRVLVTSLSLLYTDTTFETVAISLDLQDELNIYDERPDYFIVHHPFFPQPLYLRKLGVVRVR